MPKPRTITLFAGGGTKTEDNVPAIEARCTGLAGIAMGMVDGALYLAESERRIRKVKRDGSIATVVDDPSSGASWLAVIDADTLFVSAETTGVRKFSGGSFTSVKGPADGWRPKGIAQYGPGYLYIADSGVRQRIWMYKSDTLERLDSAPGLRALCAEVRGTLYASSVRSGSELQEVVLRLTPNGQELVAGGGTSTADKGLALNARLQGISALSVDPLSNLYIAESHSSRVRKVTVDGQISTVVQNSDLKGLIENPKEFQPAGMALDASGDLYVSDSSNNIILRVEGPHRIEPTDIYMEPIPRSGVFPGRVFPLGGYVRNRGHGTVDGKDVEVRLSLPVGFIGKPSFKGHLGRRGFTGLTLKPHNGSFLDGVYNVTASPQVSVGEHSCGVVVRYKGQPVHSEILPVIVSSPGEHLDELSLHVRQRDVPDARPGALTVFEIVITGVSKIEPGDITQIFQAPDGFTFTYEDQIPKYCYGETGTPEATFAHYALSDDGKQLTITSNPHLNNTQNDLSPLRYRLGAKAAATASVGTFRNGFAKLGRLQAAPLVASVKQPVTVGSLTAWPSENGQVAVTEHAFPFPLHVSVGDGWGGAVGGALVKYEIEQSDRMNCRFATATGPQTTVRVRSGSDGMAAAPELIAGSVEGTLTIRITAPDDPLVPAPKVTAHVRKP